MHQPSIGILSRLHTVALSAMTVAATAQHASFRIVADPFQLPPAPATSWSQYWQFALNDAGAISLNAKALGPGVPRSEWAVFSDAGGDGMKLIAGQGFEIEFDGRPFRVTFIDPKPPKISNSGIAFFLGAIAESSPGTEGRSGAFAVTPDGTLHHLYGDENVPIDAPEFDFTRFRTLDVPRAESLDRMLVQGFCDQVEPGIVAMLAEVVPGQPIRALGVEGDPIQGLPGVEIISAGGGYYDQALRHRGTTARYTRTDGFTETSVVQLDDDGWTLLARPGDVLPGLDTGQFLDRTSPVFPLPGESGRIAVVLEITGPGVDGGNNEVVARQRDDGQLEVVATLRDQIPGRPPGEIYRAFAESTLETNKHGRVGFWSYAGSNFTRAVAVAEFPSGIRAVAGPDDPVPGFQPGDTLVDAAFSDIDDVGRVSFSGSVRSADGFSFTRAIFMTDRRERVKLMLYEGQEVVIDPDATPPATAIVTDFDLNFVMNNRGQIAIEVELDDIASRRIAILTLDDNCAADVNGDGDVNPADYNAWILAYNENNLACDQNGDGLCNPADFNAWVINFNNGC